MLLENNKYYSYKMVQFSSIFNALSKTISNKPTGKINTNEAACEMAKHAKRNELMLSSSGVIDTDNSNNLAAGYSKRGKKGFNQDTFLVWEEYGCQEDMIFCGVFDGHGPWGHVLAKRVRELMPQALLCNWQESVALNSLDHVDSMFDIWKKSYINTCASVDQQLQHQSGTIDSFYSGTAALTIVKQGELMVIANVGDSRAVLATTSDDGSLVATQLTTDLKPNLLHESKRISESRGRVHACPDEPGTYRVWMPKGETQGPGLALSRAFGDYFIKDFGLISEPEVTHRMITTTDQFAILATDGVWDVLSNQEAVDIVGRTLDRGESAKRLIQFAVSTWKRKGRAASMDDISAICLFLHPSGHSSSRQQVQEMKLSKKFL